ncbi:MAG: acyltransferase [Treponematales bacterium]
MTSKDETIRSIQFLRAIAALSVVYVHCTTAGDYPFPSAGAFGVDIFFVISGFIMAYITAGNTNQFLIKRLIRIWPLYLLATIAMTLTVVLFRGLVHSTTVSLSGFVKSILFIPGRENRGFPILGQGWTLNFEMFFYVSMALCVMLVKDKRRVSIINAAALTVFLVILNIARPDVYILDYYRKGLFPEFIYGILLYHFYRQCRGKPNKMNVQLKITLCVTLACLSYAYMVFSEVAKFQIAANRNINLGLPALLLVTSLLLLEEHIKNNKFTEWGVKLGEASYAMYLFHYHIVTFFSRLVFPRIFGDTSAFLLELAKLLLAMGLTVVFSLLIYEWIDRPIQKRLRGLLKRRVNVGA